MTARSLVRSLNAFFFEPQPATPVALYRILYGLLVIANLILLRPEWLTWYGPHAFLSMETVRTLSTGPRINFFFLLPQTEFAINAFFWIFLLCAICLTVGFMTRFSSMAVYGCLMSIHMRNLYILNSGDLLMRVTGFFLIFAPAGAALSVDRLLRIRGGKEGVAAPLCSPWAQRMIQIQTSITYFSAFCLKTQGKAWVDGTAVYYALRLDEFHRFWVPRGGNLFLMKLSAWLTMLIEFSAGVLVWFRDLRYPVLLAAACMHMFIEYSMNIPLFEWITVSTFVTFIYPEDLSRAWAWIRHRIGPRLGAPGNVVYDGGSDPSARAAKVLQAIDVFARLRFIDLHSGEAKAAYPDLKVAAGRNRVFIMTPSGPRAGFAGLRSIAPLVPLLWPLAPFSLLQRHPRHAIRAADAAK